MRLHIAVVSLDSMDNFFVFLVLSCDVNTNAYVSALNLMVNSLTHVMKKTSSLRHSYIKSHLSSKQARKLCYLN